MCYNNAEMPDNAGYYFSAALDFLNKKGPHFPEEKNLLNRQKQ
jgi:hypothetical protein